MNRLGAAELLQVQLDVLRMLRWQNGAHLVIQYSGGDSGSGSDSDSRRSSN